MPSLGPAEILVVLVVALLVFGPDKMPDMARQAGRAFREFRRVQQHLRSEIHDAVGDLTSSAPSSSPGGDPAPTLPPKDTADTIVTDATAPGAVGPVEPTVPPGDDTTTPPGPEPGSA